MKKLALVLVVLLAVSGAAFAEVGLSGEFMFGATKVGTADQSTKLVKAEVNLKAAVDDYTTVAVEFDAEGTDWTNKNVALDDFRVTTNLTGALGIDAVSLSLTAGLFDTYFCNWNYVSRSGEEYYTSAEAGSYLWNNGPTPDLAAAVDFGFEGYSLKYWMDVKATSMAVAFSGAPVDGLNFLLGYATQFATVAEGTFWVEGGYSFEAGPASVTIPASFAADLGATVSLGWSSGVAADIDAFHIAVGVGGAGTDMFKDINAEVSTSIVENADIYIIADFDMTAATVFESVDLGGKYSFGAFGLGAGYVIAANDAYVTSVWGDNNTVTGSGLYLYADLDF